MAYFSTTHLNTILINYHLITFALRLNDLLSDLYKEYLFNIRLVP